MSESKPREWWIHSTGNSYNKDVSSHFPVTHVIEYSAYEFILKELETAKAKISKCEEIIAAQRSRLETMEQIEGQLADAHNLIHQLETRSDK